MSRKKKFHQIPKEDENSNYSSWMQLLPTQNKGTERMRKWEWKDDTKSIYESSRSKEITIINIKFKEAINISLAKKIVKVMKRLLIPQ